jgi:hypothetical protein
MLNLILKVFVLKCSCCDQMNNLQERERERKREREKIELERERGGGEPLNITLHV